MDLIEFSLDKCKSIERWIDEGKDLYISQKNLAFIEKISNDVVITMDTLLARYIDALKPDITELVLNEDELDAYKFQPKALSYDLYKTTELWNSILYINNMTSITQFNKKKIKVFKLSILDSLEELMVINEVDIRANRNRIDL